MLLCGKCLLNVGSMDMHQLVKSRSLFVIVALLCLPATFVWAGERASGAGGSWRVLPLITEGKIDPAWAQVGWGGFAVDGGALRTECDERGMGTLLYKPQKFGDCQIRIVYRCEKPKSNAGAFVRLDDGVLARDIEDTILNSGPRISKASPEFPAAKYTRPPVPPETENPLLEPRRARRPRRNA